MNYFLKIQRGVGVTFLDPTRTVDLRPQNGEEFDTFVNIQTGGDVVYVVEAERRIGVMCGNISMYYNARQPLGPSIGPMIANPKYFAIRIFGDGIWQTVTCSGELPADIMMAGFNTNNCHVLSNGSMDDSAQHYSAQGELMIPILVASNINLDYDEYNTYLTGVPYPTRIMVNWYDINPNGSNPQYATKVTDIYSGSTNNDGEIRERGNNELVWYSLSSYEIKPMEISGIQLDDSPIAVDTVFLPGVKIWATNDLQQALAEAAQIRVEFDSLKSELIEARAMLKEASNKFVRR